MAKKKVSFMIDEDTLYELKKVALEERTTQTDLFIRWIKEGLDRNKEK